MEKTAVKVRRYLISSSILALAASAAGCGGSSGDRLQPTGGVTDTGVTPAPIGGVIQTGGTPTPLGGTPATGGATASAGSTVTSTAPSCAAPFSPPALVTDFSANPDGWHAALAGGKWGTLGVFTGSIFDFAGPKSTTDPATNPTWVQVKATVNQTNQYMVLAGDVAAGDYAGGGMTFDQCVNTTAYSGVQFTLGGTLAGCDLYFYAQTFDEKMPGNGQIGGCTTGCYVFPGKKLPSASGPVTVSFADLTGGQLTTAPAIANEMVGFQWQFNSPAPVGDGGQPGCTGIALTIANVSFVP